VTYDPVRNVLFLSLDRSIWTDNYRPTRVQILDDRGERLHEPEWLVWSNRILLPRGANGFITVVVTDGIRQIRGTVDLYNARIFPSDPTPTPSNTPSPTMTATPILQTATPTPIIPTATPTPTPAGGSFDIQMVYNNNSFTLINRSGEPIDLEPLQIVSNTLGQSLSGAWLGAYYQGSINAMPHATCVQAWSFEMFVGPPPLPSGCAMRASGRSLLRAGERFWLAGYFDVLYRQQLMARCDANVGTCGFDLP
jgi:hypothetical protein